MAKNRLTPRDLIATIKANRLSFKQFEAQLVRAEGSTCRLKGLRGYRFSRQAVAKAREFYFPKIENAYTRAAAKGQANAESWLKRHGFIGRKRASFFRKLTKTTPSGHPLHPHRAVRRSPITGRLEPAQVRSFTHHVLTTRGWRDAEAAGDDLAKLQWYRDAFDYVIGRRKERPFMTIADFREKGIAVYDIHGRKIDLELDEAKIRADWLQRNAGQRRSLNRKRHYIIRQRHTIPTRSARASKRGERRARGR